MRYEHILNSIDAMSDASTNELSAWVIETAESENLSLTDLHKILISKYVEYSIRDINHTLRGRLCRYIVNHASASLYNDGMRFTQMSNIASTSENDAGPVSTIRITLNISDIVEFERLIDAHARLYAFNCVAHTIDRGINRVRSLTTPKSSTSPGRYETMKELCQYLCSAMPHPVDVDDMFARYIDAFKKAYNDEWKNRIAQ